jgi:hypothetical protein
VPALPRRRRRLRWSAEAATVAVALAVAGVSLIHPWDTTNGLQRRASSPPQARGPVAVVHVTGDRSAATRQAGKKANPAKQAKRVTQIRRASSTSGTSAATSQLIAQRTPSVPTHVSSTEATTSASQRHASSTPAPLQAPTGSTAPSPLPPPGK